TRGAPRRCPRTPTPRTRGARRSAPSAPAVGRRRLRIVLGSRRHGPQGRPRQNRPLQAQHLPASSCFQSIGTVSILRMMRARVLGFSGSGSYSLEIASFFPVGHGAIVRGLLGLGRMEVVLEDLVAKGGLGRARPLEERDRLGQG